MFRFLQQVATFFNSVYPSDPAEASGADGLPASSFSVPWAPFTAVDGSMGPPLLLNSAQGQEPGDPGTAASSTRRTVLRLRRPRSAMTPYPYCDSEPPTKKQKRPVILHLPDNVVLRIFDILSGAPRQGELSGRALTQARDAFALAQTCKRFLALFRSSSMRTIIFDYSSAVVVSSTRGGRHESQLARLCAFAGEHLKTLIISWCYEGYFDMLFHILEARCPNLVNIDISDSDYEFTFSEALLSLLESRPWKTVRLPMGMRSTMAVTPTPSPSEPDAAFLYKLTHEVGPWDAATQLRRTDHLRQITDIALPTRLPACTEMSIVTLWKELPNLRVLSLSADLPESVLIQLSVICPELSELRLNMLARPREDYGYPRAKHNPVYSRIFKAYGKTLKKLLLGVFDLERDFITDLVKDCPRLEAVELRDCRDLDAHMVKLLGGRLVSLRDTYLNASTVVAVPMYATNLESCDLLLDDEQLEVDMTQPVIRWATAVGRLPKLQHLVIKGPEDRILVRWDTVMSFLVESIKTRSEPLKLKSLRVERVKGLTADIWAMLLKVVGRPLQIVSAFESQPLSALQFIASISQYCPYVERIRLPRLWGQGGDEELYDAITELMRLEVKAPHCCVAALRMNTDFCFTFERRGGLEWVADDGP